MRTQYKCEVLKYLYIHINITEDLLLWITKKAFFKERSSAALEIIPYHMDCNIQTPSIHLVTRGMKFHFLLILYTSLSLHAQDPWAMGLAKERGGLLSFDSSMPDSFLSFPLLRFSPSSCLSHSGVKPPLSWLYLSPGQQGGGLVPSISLPRGFSPSRTSHPLTSPLQPPGHNPGPLVHWAIKICSRLISPMSYLTKDSYCPSLSWTKKR